MKALLAALAALAFAIPAAAQDGPAWAGVWGGRVGTLPIRLCVDIDGSGNARGSYYYLSRLEPIALSDYDSEGGWTEQAPGSDATALWEFAEQTGTRLRGAWRQGGRSLPFDLRPIAWTEGEWGGPCSSDAFLEPRVGGRSTKSEQAALGSWPYTAVTYQPPAQFAPEVTIESFAFTPEQPGDAAINAKLVSYLPRGTVADEFLQCLAGAISALGYDGDFAEVLRPFAVGTAFLVVMESSSTYCGGAHPNHYYRYITFDRQSGEEIDLFDWLGESAIEHHPADGQSYDTVRPALRELVLARDPTEGLAEDETYPPECRELVADEEFWTLGLSDGGMLLVPIVPHVATPCAETFTVPWDALAPFLSAEGKAGVARLRGG